MWKTAVLVVSFCYFVAESWIIARQLRALEKANVPRLPARELDEETFRTSHEYKRAKARLSLASGLWSQIIGAVLIVFDVLPWLWTSLGDLLDRWPLAATNTGHSIVFALCYLWFYNVIYLPIQLYGIFVIEAEFGFNRQTPGLFFRDFIMVQALNSVLLAPTLALILFIIDKTGDTFAVYVWLGTALIQALIVTLDPILFTPLFNTLRPLTDKSILPKLKALAAEVGFPLHRLYVSDSSRRSAHSNAYFYGFPWQMQLVIQDTLLEKASADVIVAVVTHELGHWKHQHSAQPFLIQQVNLGIIFSVFAMFASSPSLYRSFGFHTDTPIIACVFLFYRILLPVNAGLQLVHNSIFRTFEFSADRFAKEAGKGGDLSNALIKLHTHNLGALGSGWLYACYHHSHPGLLERLVLLGMKEKD